MAFFVGDTQEQRHEKISALLAGGEPVMATLLAAADFEWTVRRAIIAFGESPNKVIQNEVLAECSGLDRYKRAWKAEVKKRMGVGLPELIADWAALKEAFLLRHRLIHGTIGSTGMAYAERRIATMLEASQAVGNWASDNHINLFEKLPVRKKRRQLP